MLKERKKIIASLVIFSISVFCLVAVNRATACDPGEQQVFDEQMGLICVPQGGGAENAIPGGGGAENAVQNNNPNSVGLPNFLGVTTVSQLLSRIFNFLVPLALSFAALMLIWSGFLFATAQGNDEKLKQARKNFIWTIIGIFIILASNAIIHYISGLLSGNNNAALTNSIASLLNTIVGLLFALVTVYFIWGVLTYVRAAGDEKAIEQGKKHMLWGIIGMTIMAGAWGIVAIIQNFIG